MYIYMFFGATSSLLPFDIFANNMLTVKHPICPCNLTSGYGKHAKISMG